MDNNVMVFKNNEFGKLSVLLDSGQEYFPAADCAQILNYKNPHKAVRDHCPHLTKYSVWVQTGKRADGSPAIQKVEKLFIPEGDLYRLIIRSNMPQAVRFERWVFEEILPSVRRRGIYTTDGVLEQILNSPDFGIRMLSEIKAERRKRAELEGKIEEDRPKVLFASAVETAKTSILVGDLAKILRQNGIRIGQKRMFNWLRENGYLMKRGSSRNMPTQKSMELGLFEVRETAFTGYDGSTHITKTPKITGKGQIYFVNIFMQRKWAI